MAARHLRRVQEQLAKHSVQPADEEEQEEEEVEEAGPSKAPFNPFDLLSGDEVRRRAGGQGQHVHGRWLLHDTVQIHDLSKTTVLLLLLLLLGERVT